MLSCKLMGYRTIYIRKRDRDERGGFQPAGRVIMERVLGRRLGKNEVAHHLNGNPCDNRPENLAVLTYREHGKVHYWQNREQPKPKPKIRRLSPSLTVGNGPDYTSHMGAYIRSRRLSLGLSQAQLSVLAGISEAEVSRLEAGHRRPNFDTGIRLALALGLSAEELYRQLQPCPS